MTNHQLMQTGLEVVKGECAGVWFIAKTPRIAFSRPSVYYECSQALAAIIILFDFAIGYALGTDKHHGFNAMKLIG